jgi:pimeloyl-ACP methyl ester carboxylesterase
VHLVQVKGFAGLPLEANAAGPVCAPVAEELARYIDEAGLGAPAVIGHSMGATIAMMLAARYPGAVGRLMIVDMLPWLGGLAGASPADAAVQAAAEQMRSLTLSSQGASIAEMVASQTNGTARGDEMVRYARDSDANTLANAFYELILTDLRAELANIRAPITVLYVVPTHAPLPPDQYEAFLIDSYRGAQHARLIKLEGVGHYMMLSDPAGFQAQVQAFLTR